MPRAWRGICAVCEGCVLHDGHEGECKVAEMEEEEYEVEAIRRQRMRLGACSRSTRAPRRAAPAAAHAFATACLPAGEAEYLVKWLNWPEEDSTWETEDALESATEILLEWKRGGAAPSEQAKRQPDVAAEAKQTPQKQPKRKPAPSADGAESDESEEAIDILSKPNRSKPKKAKRVKGIDELDDELARAAAEGEVAMEVIGVAASEEEAATLTRVEGAVLASEAKAREAAKALEEASAAAAAVAAVAAARQAARRKTVSWAPAAAATNADAPYPMLS